MGRRRHRWPVRRSPVALLRARPLERGRPDTQGATVRADEQRGQSWGGRQGILFLPRQYADAFLDADAVQIPEARISVCLSRRDERIALALADRIRADRYRNFRRGPLF